MVDSGAPVASALLLVSAGAKDRHAGCSCGLAVLPLFISGAVRAWLWPRARGRIALTSREQAFLEAAGFAAARRAEWSRARSLAHRVLPAGASVLSARDGAPRLLGAPGLSISLSHEGAATAVAVRRGGRVAIDLARRLHARRLAVILSRLAPLGRGCDDPVRAWVALECALKLRRLSVYSLVGRSLALRRSGAGVEVAGLRAPVRVRLVEQGGLVLGVAW